jgi:4-hydroxybenzoate polyprenyltransferase
VLITASGYVINDYYDTEIDHINRPERRIAGNTWSLATVKKVYLHLVVWGGVLAVVAAWRLGLIPYIIVYPFVIIGLWLYSFALKCKPIIGNLWIACFCGGVIGIVALPDWLKDNEEVIRPELWFYMAFALLSTWYREIVKDLEDAEGDKNMNCQTAIVSYGIQFGKIMALGFAMLLMASLFWWLTTQTYWVIRWILMVVQGLILVSMVLVWLAKDNVYFRRSSAMIKLVMLIGTLLLLSM